MSQIEMKPEVTLTIDGKKKTFKQSAVLARKHREALELQIQLEKEPLTRLEQLDKLLKFVIEFFGNQFTADDYYDGCPIEDLDKQLSQVLAYAVYEPYQYLNKGKDEEAKNE
jgi:hypothetical protein